MCMLRPEMLYKKILWYTYNVLYIIMWYIQEFPSMALYVHKSLYIIYIYIIKPFIWEAWDQRWAGFLDFPDCWIQAKYGT